MRTRLILFLCGTMALSAMALAAGTAPALAGCRGGERCWLHAHRSIYYKHNRIAYLEANPDVDDSFKGPVITHLHHKVLRIRAKIGPRWPVWPTPCCYSRKPIYIR
jgi:hypothetical protein